MNTEIVLLRDNGGYNEYGVDITSYMDRIFPELEKAYIIEKANSSNVDALKKYYDTHDIFDNSDVEEGIYDIDGLNILLEFKNGNKVTLSNSEFGCIQLEKEINNNDN